MHWILRSRASNKAPGGLAVQLTPPAFAAATLIAIALSAA
jgi:hypothetical protein